MIIVTYYAIIIINTSIYHDIIRMSHALIDALFICLAKSIFKLYSTIKFKVISYFRRAYCLPKANPCKISVEYPPYCDYCHEPEMALNVEFHALHMHALLNA